MCAQVPVTLGDPLKRGDSHYRSCIGRLEIRTERDIHNISFWVLYGAVTSSSSSIDALPARAEPKAILEFGFDILLARHVIEKLATGANLKSTSAQQQETLLLLISPTNHPLAIRSRANLLRMLTLYIRHFQVPPAQAKADLVMLFREQPTVVKACEGAGSGMSVLQVRCVAFLLPVVRCIRLTSPLFLCDRHRAL